MKKQIIFLIFITVVFVSFIGCKKNTAITCNLATTATQPPVEMNIVYTAIQTGDGAIASLSYVTISGTVTVQNPQLPWTITVPILTTTNVAISATGTTNNGSLKITYDGTNGSATIKGSDFCEHQAD